MVLTWLNGSVVRPVCMRGSGQAVVSRETVVVLQLMVMICVLVLRRTRVLHFLLELVLSMSVLVYCVVS